MNREGLIFEKSAPGKTAFRLPRLDVPENAAAFKMLELSTLPVVVCSPTSPLFPAWLPLIALLTAAIIASTLFLKQHVLADVAGGTMLAALAVLLSWLVT